MNEKSKIIIKFFSSLVLLLITYLPAFEWMLKRWTEQESYYGHGFLIPIVSIFIIWQRRNILSSIKFVSNGKGIFIIAIALFVNIICAVLKIYFISGITFVFALYGLILFFFGKEAVRNLIFPVFFLLAMIPIPTVLIAELTVRLKLFAAQAAVFALNHIGFRSILDGSTIKMPSSVLEVAAPCSGLRSLISLLTLGLLFSYALKASYLKKGLLLFSAVPIALATNILRIILLSVVNDLYGEKVSMGFFHDFSGFLVFGFAFLGLYMVGGSLGTKDENQ